jgi:hypothetical protein
MSVITRKKPDGEVRDNLYQRGDLAVVVVGCDKCAKSSRTGGLKCVSDAQPRVRVVPGLNTLGPGVEDRLACLACGDCGFASGRCRMIELVGEQAVRLEATYGATRQRG